MKIRWTQDSVRLRITPTEFAAIERGQVVTQVLALPGGSWRVAIAPSPGVTALLFEDGELRVSLSKTDRCCLAEPKREGIYFEHPGDSPLRYFIEKDFPCIHPRAFEAMETPSETFAPPPGFEERKAS